MFGQIILLLCLSAFVHSATLPNIDEILSKLNFVDIGINLDYEKFQNFEQENEIDSNANVCGTDICAKDSEAILSFMDQSVNPCDDFYKFACGKYLRETVLSKFQVMDSIFSRISEKVAKQIIVALTEEIQPNDSRAFHLAKNFTHMCLDGKARDATGANPLFEILDKFGGWPVIKGDKWNENHWHWLDAHKKMFAHGLNSDVMMEFSIAPHYRDSSKRVIYIDRPYFGIPDEYLLSGLKHPHTSAYFFFMMITAIIFGANPAKAKAELYDAFKFETELAKISLRLHERHNSVIYNEFTIKTLQATFPYMDWRDYINWNLNNAITIDDDEVLFVPDVKYFHQLNDLVEKTPKRVVANYFAWRSVSFSSGLLNNALFERSQQYEAVISGRKLTKDARLAACVRQTMKYFPIMGSAAYVRKFFKKDSKKIVESLTFDIHDAFLEKLKKISWMDESTRHEAIRKAKAMLFDIGYPDELIDDDKLDEHYHDLELQNDSLFHNVLRIRKFDQMHKIKQYRQPIEKKDWREHATRSAMVNAFNIPQHNTIQIPAAVLQGRIFSAKRPSYETYGTIGWIIGHEITHGFDNSGRELDLNGNLVNWWQEDTLKEFKTRAQCFIDKYSSYTHPTLNFTVNGARTLGENIADVGGIKAAYAAYQRFIRRNGPEPVLPGLQDYTPNQLFWISGAQIWCSTIKPQFTRIRYEDVHSPDNFRVLGTFSSSEEFAKDFKCASNTPMNPVKKCEIW